MINKIVFFILLIAIGFFYFFTNSPQKHYSIDVNDCELIVSDDYSVEYNRDSISLSPVEIGKQFYFINFFDDSNSSMYMKKLINKMKYNTLNIKKLQNIDLYECENYDKNKIYYMVGKTFYMTFPKYTEEVKKMISSCNKNWKTINNNKINEYMITAIKNKLNITRNEAIDYLEKNGNTNK